MIQSFFQKCEENIQKFVIFLIQGVGVMVKNENFQ